LMRRGSLRNGQSTDRTRCCRAMSDWDSHRKEPRLHGACVVVSALLLTPAPTHAAPDIELGRYLSSECVTCHGGATPTSTIPDIYGLAEKTFTEAIKAYREKRLDNPVMQNIASRLKDEEIEALAAYFARTKRP
jgi:cytochrome c553